MDNRQHKNRDAMVMLDKIIEFQAFTAGTFAQKFKLIAFTRALELLPDKWAKMYTDFKCAFMIVHAYRNIYGIKRVLDLRKLRN